MAWLLVAAPASGQTASVLVGGMHARYADSVSGTAGMTSFLLSGYTPNAAGILSGNLSKFSGGEWVTQLSGFGTALFPVHSGVRLGLSAAGDANRLEGGAWNGQMSGGILGVLSKRSTLFSLGVSLGTAATVFDSTVNTISASSRLQHRISRGTSISGGVVAVSADTVRYADGSLELAFTGTKMRVSFGGGVRAGDLADDPWAHGHLEYDLLPRLTYELTLGRYPRDLVGFTDGLYLATGVRVRLSKDSRSSTEAEDRPVLIERRGDNLVRVELSYAADASTLEIVGAWNGWLPIRMQKIAGGKWSIELPLGPGIYQYAIVVDGNVWTVPDGVPAEPDDFGGEVATLVVKGDGAD